MLKLHLSKEIKQEIKADVDLYFRQNLSDDKFSVRMEVSLDNIHWFKICSIYPYNDKLQLELWDDCKHLENYINIVENERGLLGIKVV